MDVLLIPGFWLDASSWDDVVPVIEGAGHRTRPMTLPGLESRDADRAGIGLADHVSAVVAAIDEAPEPVVLVGHSGGAAVIQGAADARPDRVATLIYVDSFPPAPGNRVNDELPVVDGEIPLPDWSAFEEPDLVDMTDDLRARLRSMAIPQPANVASDPAVLDDPRRHDIPAVIIACEFTSEQIRGWLEQSPPFLTELAAMKNLEIIDVPTGHWPQLTRPQDLGRAIVQAIG